MIRVIDHAIPGDLLRMVAEAVTGLAFRYGWSSNKTLHPFCHWNHNIALSGRKNTEDVSARLDRKKQYGPIRDWWDFLQKDVIGPADMLRCYVNAHTFGVEGYPHIDSKRPGETTALMYLNPMWRREWAGETEVFDEAGVEIVQAVMPRFGRILIFPSERYHVARSVTRMCPEARLTLVTKVRLRA